MSRPGRLAIEIMNISNSEAGSPSTLQGIGDTVMTMISGIAELIVRLFMSLVAIRWMGGDAVLWGEVFAWIGADFVLCGALFKHFRSPELSLDNSGARSPR